MNKKREGHVRRSSPAVTAATLLLLATIIVLISNMAATITTITPVAAVNSRSTDAPDAPSVVTGENVYIAWWNGTTGQPDVQTDVMFRASTDGGETFSDRINLSNSSDADSGLVEISAEGTTVIVTWWELNQTSETPVARVSTDAGETFGPMLRLATNGTISTTEEGEGGGED
jgi:hypothetical protein